MQPFETIARPGERLLTWGALLAVAWLVFELTAEPLLGPALGGIHIAWADWRLAWWLRRRDPDAARGRVAFWLYVSWGLVKLFVFALSITILVGLLHDAAAAGGQGVESLLGAVLTWLVALLILPLVTLPACRGARRLGLKVWVNSALDGVRRRDEWPPRGGRINCFVFVVLAAVGALLIGPPAGLVFLTLGVDDPAIVEFGLIAVIVASLPMAVIMFNDKLADWFHNALFPRAATSSEEFWE
jgi:hypothetical protein